jgi:hypothetical protein
VPTRIDLQRYKKIYPFLRQQPKILYLTETEDTLARATIETATVSFGGSDIINYTFTKDFTTTPLVTVTPIGTASNFNVYIQSVSITGVVIKASVPNSQSVNINIVEAA